MSKRLTIDKAGRVVIPKAVREAFHLSAGDSLLVDASGEDITLRPVHEAAPLKKENGLWVYRTGHPMKEGALLEWIDRSREDRIRGLAR